MLHMRDKLRPPRFEIIKSDGAHATHCYFANAGFMYDYQRNSIEDALSSYHEKHKDEYRTAVFVDEDWWQYWLEKSDNPYRDKTEYTITKGKPKGEYPYQLRWLR